jgi:hypothetical protein
VGDGGWVEEGCVGWVVWDWVEEWCVGWVDWRGCGMGGLEGLEGEVEGRKVKGGWERG